jgi:hypothetical protein
MKRIAVLLAGLQLVAGAALPAEANLDATDSAGAELSGLWENMYGDKPSGKTVHEQGVPAGVFLETSLNKQTAATPGKY